jgi:ribosomal-protein-alanine N-acetyltransferase
MTAAAPRITTARLVLEPLAEAEVDRLYVGWLNDPEAMRFSNQRFHTHTEATQRAYVASFAGGPNLLLAVRRADDGRMIGSMTAYVAVPHGTADIGLLVGERTLWGRGYGREAWSALMAYLLGAGGLRKVTAGAVRANAAMCAIMERTGMHLEAVRRRQELIDGVENDVLLYARFRDR